MGLKVLHDIHLSGADPQTDFIVYPRIARFQYRGITEWRL
jgi:hypothetical protein